MYLDFFSLQSQVRQRLGTLSAHAIAKRSALTVVSNCAKHASPERFDLVADSIPILSNILLQNKVCSRDYLSVSSSLQDKILLDLTCRAFCSLVDAVASHPTLVEKLNEHGMVLAALSLTLDSSSVLDKKQFVPMMKMLTKMCHSCPHLAEPILSSGAAASIRFALLTHFK